MELKNETLLAKYFCRVMHILDSLMSKLMIKKYGKGKLEDIYIKPIQCILKKEANTKSISFDH